MGEIISVEILGNKMNIETTMKKDEAIMVVQFVENLMKEIKNKNPYIPFSSVATIAALNLAEEIFIITKKIKELESMV
uniref:Cell division protein ZapA n=1 Tax=candidate division WOR-3 bacterium TaxID=2052148 RepID=A0A7C4Y5X7_UNCW3